MAKSRCGAVMLQSQMQVYVPSMLKSWGKKSGKMAFHERSACSHVIFFAHLNCSLLDGIH